MATPDHRQTSAGTGLETGFGGAFLRFRQSKKLMLSADGGWPALTRTSIMPTAARTATGFPSISLGFRTETNALTSHEMQVAPVKFE